MKAGISKKADNASASKLLILKVGAIGFEPTTSRSRTERSTRLSHAPMLAPAIINYARQRRKRILLVVFLLVNRRVNDPQLTIFTAIPLVDLETAHQADPARAGEFRLTLGGVP